MERKIIQEGFALLRKEKHYDQLTVVRKLKYLNYALAEATFSNVLTGKKVSDKTLATASKGIQELINVELGHVWQDGGFEKQGGSGWQAVEVRQSRPEEPSVVLNPGLIFHLEGRLTIQQKVDFFSSAQKEVIEFGVTLNTFSSYFTSRRDSEFKRHVETLLGKGVQFKCFMLDPDCNEAGIYFEDRRREQKDEINNTDAMKGTMRRLGIIKRDIDGAGYPGTFEAFAYRHIPYNYFMVLDGGTPNGRMMISHYIYGLPRAKCPVLEITKSDNHDLYMRYWASLKMLMKDAKPIFLDSRY